MNRINEIRIMPRYDFKAGQIKQSSNVNTETQKFSQDLDKMSILGKSQINFRGGSFKLEPNDRLFVGAIATAFGLSAAVVDKIKGVISNYLKNNNYKSMSDIGGEDNIDQQSELTTKINNVLQLKGKNYERLVSKVIDRCDEGDNYFPYEDNEISLVEILGNAIKDERKKIKENDEKLIKSIARVLELNSEQSKKLYSLVDSYMKEVKLKTFKEFNDDDNINEVAGLLDLISNEFNLSDEDNTMISIEFTRRAFSNENEYEPIIHPLDRNNEFAGRDTQIFYKILNNYNIRSNDAEKLHYAMKNDAYENGFKSIFEIFKSNENPHFSTNFVLDSKSFQGKKDDILIDLFIAAQQTEQIESEMNIQKQKRENNYPRYCAALCLLDEKFNFTAAQILQLKSYFKKQEIDIRSTNDIWKAAYEIPELFDLPPKSTNIITETLKSINDISEDKLNDYHFKYCEMIISKRSNHE